MADNQTPELFGQTPSQTVGPYFHYGLPWKGGADLIGQSDMGARPDLFPAAHDVLASAPAHPAPRGAVIELFGQVLDGAGAPVPDAMLEIWQADADGRYDAENPAFTGFGRAATAADGGFRFRTIRPGPVPGPRGTLQAPHIAIGVFARGMIKRLVTRAYFDDAPENQEDPILVLVPAPRRATLIARGGDGQWRLDIRLQGENETVFLDV